MRLVSLLLLLSLSVFAQGGGPEGFKTEAQSQMQRGKYGEAIDLLNKYISAKPQVVDGYNLRGLCYEKRNQLESAVFDFRSARKVAPNNTDVQKNLERATATWYKQLNDKISGHKREIAINPNIPINYLEIGKCKKQLGEWIPAEEWYDDYLKREEPSADEVIRYTEILAKNNHIEKGEKILKRFVEKYPRDHRLWSRYGYFTMWLGKKKIAVEAFKSALALRPYFKEAQDGLEQAEDRPYIYTYYDTTTHKAGEQIKEKAVEEYAIDKYYRIVKQNPADSDTRFTLVDQLLKVNRTEEAYEQLQFLSAEFSGQDKFTILWDTVTARRERSFQIKETEYRQRLAKNPNDKEAAMNLAEIMGRQMNFDSAVVVLQKYMEGKSESEDLDVRFLLGRYAAWNYNFEGAIEQLNILLAKDPNNLQYQLFRAQVAVWTTTDQELAHQYLDNVLKSDPKNFSALLAKATLYIRERNFTEGKAKIDEATAVNPKSKEIETIQNFYDGVLALEDDRKNYEILVAARELAVGGDCPASILKYDEYFSKIKAPSKFEMVEYADVNSCALNFTKSVEIYDKLLSEEPDYDVSVLKAKATLWSGDSVSALSQFLTLVKQDTSNFEARFYLAETYEHFKEYDKAKELYEGLLVNEQDTNKISLLNKRIGWIPVATSSNIIANFPIFTRIAPVVSYYSDNQNLSYLNAGGMLELGFTTYLSLGISFGRAFLKGVSNQIINKYFTSFKAHILLYPIKNFFISVGNGNLSYQGYDKRKIEEWIVKYEKEKKISLGLRFEKTDAVMVLYSVPLVDNRYKINLYRLDGWYYFSPITKIDGHFSYFTLSDGNAANDFQLRFGRKFTNEVVAGYEYYYTNYSGKRQYYSPQNFVSHSIWGEYEYLYDDNTTFTFGGKLGYVPDNDVIIREVSAQALYKLSNYLVASAKLNLGQSYRVDSEYQYFSGFASIYWSFY